MAFVWSDIKVLFKNIEMKNILQYCMHIRILGKIYYKGIIKFLLAKCLSNLHFDMIFHCVRMCLYEEMQKIFNP